MNAVSFQAISYCKNLFFSFSGDLRNQQVDLSKYDSYTFIIDIDGSVYQGASSNPDNATVVIIGGIDKFLYSQSQELHTNFYITEQQKITLYKVMREHSKFYDSAQITSDNDKLEQALISLYSNYCG